jgi:inner membrane protein
VDNVTHSLTGVMLSRAGLNRWHPRATLLLVLCSNIPDADIVTLALGPLPYLDYHRHLTHALVVAPLMALPPVALLRWLDRGRPFAWFPALAIATLGVLVHLFMDSWNNYGVRLLLPFSAEWFALDGLYVVDPWILAVLALALAAPWLSRLVASEIGSRQKPTGRGWAIFALLFLLAWTGGRVALHQRAVETLAARRFAGQEPLRVAAWPTPLNPFRWTGYVSTETFWRLQDVNLLLPFDPDAGRTYYKPTDAARINAAKRTPEAQGFLRFSQYPVWRMVPVTEPEGGIAVEGVDVRFGSPEDGRFQLRVVLDQNLHVVSSTFSYGSLQR